MFRAVGTRQTFQFSVNHSTDYGFEMCGNFHGDFQWSIGGDLQLQFLRLLCLMTSLAVRVTFSDSNLDSTTGKTFDAAAKQALILWKTTSIHLYNSYT